MYAINIIKNEKERKRYRNHWKYINRSAMKKKTKQDSPLTQTQKKSSPKESEKGRALPSYYLADSSSWQKIYKIICIFNTDNCEELS